MRMGLLIGILGSLLTGCSKSDTNIVKNGFMGDYKALTVGEAFDRWQTCDAKQSAWSEFKTQNGISVVEFQCYDKNVPTLASKMSAADERIYNQRIAQYNEKIEHLKAQLNDSETPDVHKNIYEQQLKDTISFKEDTENQYRSVHSALNVTKIIYRFQWIVNKDHTFEIAHASSVFSWSDRQYIIENLANIDETISQVYQNKDNDIEILKSDDDSVWSHVIYQYDQMYEAAQKS